MSSNNRVALIVFVEMLKEAIFNSHCQMNGKGKKRRKGGVVGRRGNKGERELAVRTSALRDRTIQPGHGKVINSNVRSLYSSKGIHCWLG